MREVTRRFNGVHEIIPLCLYVFPYIIIFVLIELGSYGAASA